MTSASGQLPPTTDTLKTTTEAWEDTTGETQTPTSATLGGATSEDVHSGIGKPLTGMTSSEIHHNGRQQHRKRDSSGLGQFGETPEMRKQKMEEEKAQE